MKKLVFALLAVALLAACKKDPVYVSQHPFSEKQQKAVETFVGDWAQDSSLFVLHPDTLLFGRSSDTNVVVLEYSYMDGWVEKFQYQGEVVLREYKYGTDAGYRDIPCWWYVDYSADRIELWRKEDSVRYWRRELKISSGTHFACRSVGSDGSWSQFSKI